MLDKHTFKTLILQVARIEEGISKIEAALNCQLDQNWMTEVAGNLITAIAEGFFTEDAISKLHTYHSMEACQLETIEELLYHFIYLEDCGNDSEHCQSKLVIIDEGKESQQSIPCTNIDQLYKVIDLYLNNTTVNFTFNYCHSCKDDNDKLKKESIAF